MRVLFLDIDGVLNSTRTCVALGDFPHDVTPKGLALFDQVALKLIRALCHVGDIQIVLSSSWRIIHDYQELAVKLDLPIIDHTPNRWDPGQVRGHEIQAWLDEHPEVEKYVIVDDDSDMLEEQKASFVKTFHEDGLTWAPFCKLCDLFGVNPHDCHPRSDAMKTLEPA